MKQIAAYLILALPLLACAGMSSCKKHGSAPSPSKSELLVGIFSRTRLEVSNSSGGSDWKDLTASYPGQTLTFRGDGSYVNREGGSSESGSWEIPLNGDALIMGSISYTMEALSERGLTLVEHLEPTGGLAADGRYYKYWRYSYSR